MRYPAGTLDVSGKGGPLTLRLSAAKNRISTRGMAMAPAELSFTPVGTERTVPVRQACGHYLDWYEPAEERREAAERAGDPQKPWRARRASRG